MNDAYNIMMLNHCALLSRREQASDALRTPLPIGISMSLPELPNPRPIEAGHAGSEWGMGRRAPLKENKHAAEKRLADLDLDQRLAEQAAEDKRWREVEEEGTVVVEIVRCGGNDETPFLSAFPMFVPSLSL